MSNISAYFGCVACLIGERSDCNELIRGVQTRRIEGPASKDAGYSTPFCKAAQSVLARVFRLGRLCSGDRPDAVIGRHYIFVTPKPSTSTSRW